MDLGGNKNYADTLKELNKLRLLEKFPELQVELDKKQKDVKKRRKLATIVFGAAFFSFSVLSMYLCIVVAPPVVVAVALGLTKTVGTAGIWVYGMMKDYEEALESKIDLLRLTENNTKSNIEAMKSIRNLVEKLIISISSILKTVERQKMRKT
ncbi:UPF0496 protein [Raphanus sativus]|nr:UPF0496 protein [Raphanus sativus]